MYPFLRMAREYLVQSRAPALPLFGTHVSRHRCWPWDLDPFGELNNGRTLTLCDLGRLPLARRVGLIAALEREGWGLTMAGAVVRYRRRVRAFEWLEMHSRCIGWDARFLYLEQNLWRRGEATTQVVYRAAVTDASGIVPAARVAAALGHDGPSPELPAWVRAWIAAEDLRPWPPAPA